MAEVSSSAPAAKQMGYLRESDPIVMNTHEVLFVAKQQVTALNAQGFRPPMSPTFEVAGKPGVAALKSLLVNMREGHFISDYDFKIGSLVAEVMCGGNIEAGSRVDEEWILRLERDAFMELSLQEKTRERIKHMLTTGRPLRN